MEEKANPKEEFPKFFLTPEEQARFAKRRNSMSATKFAHWLTKRDPIPYDHGITYIRKNTIGSADDLPDDRILDEMIRDQPKHRGNQEHELFDAACRYWSSEKAREDFEEYVKTNEERFQVATEHLQAIEQTGKRMKTFAVCCGLALIAWFFALILLSEHTRIAADISYFLFG